MEAAACIFVHEIDRHVSLDCPNTIYIPNHNETAAASAAAAAATPEDDDKDTMASLLYTPGVNQAGTCLVLLLRARVDRIHQQIIDPSFPPYCPTHTGAHNITRYLEARFLSIWEDQGGKGRGRTFANTSFSEGQRVCATGFAVSVKFASAKESETYVPPGLSPLLAGQWTHTNVIRRQSVQSVLTC